MSRRRALLETPVRTQADLEGVWRHLMEPLGFGDGSLWFMLIGPDDLMLPVMNQLIDEGRAPSARDLEQLAQTLAHVGADFDRGCRWAFLRARPGRGGPTEGDRAFVSTLLAATRAAGLVCDVVHLATDDTLVPLPFDALAGTG